MSKSTALADGIERIMPRLPIVNFGIRLLEAENDKALALLAANVAGYVLLGTVAFGSWFLMPVIYVAVALAAVSILLATRG